MKEAEARNVLLIRAIEMSDTSAAILPREDRQWASDTARAQVPAGKDTQDFIAARAGLLRTWLHNHQIALRPFDLITRWPHWLYWALPLAAFLLGALANEMTAGQRINIVSLPLLAMLAWNALVYLLLAINALGHLLGMRAKSAVLTQLLASLTTPHAHLPKESPLYASLIRFGRDWLDFSAPQMTQRAACILHLSAALLAAGTLAGMYVRGLGLAYLAGWESTFLTADTLQSLLHLVLGPAAHLTGIPLASAGQLAAIQWSSSQAGENAANWIHLYATTVALCIILPRLFLAAFAAGRAHRLQQRFPIADRNDPYLHRLLVSQNNKNLLVNILPYSYHPAAAVQQRLSDLLCSALGASSQIEFAPSIPYGSEEEYLDLLREVTADTKVPAVEHNVYVVLFSTAATPEHEIQGALMKELQHILTQSKNHPPLLAILDESAYRQRLSGQAGAQERLAERHHGWQQMLQKYSVQTVLLDLGDDNGNTENNDSNNIRKQLQNIVLEQG